MIDLHERLSEFSYGYGITREVEGHLQSVGIKTAPFLPSLVDEANLGFDVRFDKPGGVILLQFKLGQSLRRFVRKKKTAITPALDRPFWRFNVNTAEPSGQYETLLKAEQGGAEVYYIAPMFVDWSEYLPAYEAGEVFDRSVRIQPSWIQSALASKGEPDGKHRIVYDQLRTYVCSEPTEIGRQPSGSMGPMFREKIVSRKVELSKVTRHVFAGLKERRAIRKQAEPSQISSQSEEGVEVLREEYMASPRVDPNAARDARLERLRGRSKTEDDAVAAAVGIEALSWSREIGQGVKVYSTG